MARRRLTTIDNCVSLFENYGMKAFELIAQALDDNSFELFVNRCLDRGLMCLGTPPINTSGEYPFLI